MDNTKAKRWKVVNPKLKSNTTERESLHITYWVKHEMQWALMFGTIETKRKEEIW